MGGFALDSVLVVRSFGPGVQGIHGLPFQQELVYAPSELDEYSLGSLVAL